MTERDVRRWILGSFSSARMARVEGHIFVLGLGGGGRLLYSSVGERKWKEEGEVFNSLIHREEGSI